MSDFVPGVPGRHVMQVAWLVDDLHAACVRWTRTTGIGPFLTVPHVVLEEYRYRGKPAGGLDFSVAIAQWGGVQVELVQQHCNNPSAYRDTIAKGQGGFHHLAIYADDYDAAYAHYRDQGFAAAVDGTFGGFRFSYIDTSTAIGCMIELIEENPAQSDFFRRVAHAADGWDGETDPIRPGFPA
ncbi:VOC family protein [Novosphingobium sp. BL-8H]|uniref:VOC family protein n=1 Tax=Novosphingobium sp. BL-8H TaxID=3127640 RepID=UPI00375750A2